MAPSRVLSPTSLSRVSLLAVTLLFSGALVFSGCTAKGKIGSPKASDKIKGKGAGKVGHEKKTKTLTAAAKKAFGAKKSPLKTPTRP
ncbi:MAG: hypothetical protein KAI47_13820, partial [Deltaproteobacteria bacterium]|nr:hypothetical protein [Deltaproteobacteria bacterium]